MSFPRHDKYKASAVKWLGDVPEHWHTRRLKFLFNLEKRPPGPEDGIVTAFRDGEVTLRANRRVDGFTNAVHEIGYQGVRPGDLVIHAMDAFAGAIGVSDSEGKSTPVYSVCTPVDPHINARYYAALLRHMALSGYVNALAKGVRERSTEFRWADASEVVLPVPSRDEQRSIVAFLDHEAAKIDALIDEQKDLIELLHEEVKCLVLASRATEGTRELRLGHAVDVMARPVIQKEGEAYRPLGMYNRGRGIFHKDPREMADMGDSDFFWVRSGDLVISGQFAWEGAVGLAGEEEDGCVVSHRYPVLRAKGDVALTEYLYALLLTKHGDFILNESSWGAAGRNRPLNLGLLLKEQIWVPSMKTQMKVAHALHQCKRLASEIEIQRDLLHEHRSALISAAVTGKIDVRGLAPQPEAVAA